jgi:hypothetical protein
MSEYQDHGGALAGACIFSAVVLVAVLCKLYLGELVSFIAGLGSALLGALPEVFAGVVIGGVVVACLFLLLGVFSISIEVGQRRASQVPAHLRTIPLMAPTTLRWVSGLLPGAEGAAWLAEVSSCLAETSDEHERRRYVSSYRRGVPRLVWNSWMLYFSSSQSRKLS